MSNVKTRRKNVHSILFWCFLSYKTVYQCDSKNQIFLFTRYKCLIKYSRSFTLTFSKIHSDSNKNSNSTR
uniref:Uncharacterized protein n=1 Tax=Anguilla anguilla TaxID=7936 RepID=A0A0E9XZQ3_ANGAN